MRFWYIEMMGSYENMIWFPFSTREEAEDKLKQLKSDDKEGKDDFYADTNKRNYIIIEYKGGLIEFGYTE